MTRAVLCSYNPRVDASTIVGELKKQGFDDVTVEFVQIIHKQLKKKPQKHTKSWRENADNAFYYTTKRSDLPDIWSDRFFLLCGQSDDNSYQIELIDTYNEKSA